MPDKPITLGTIFNGEAMAQFQNAQEEVLENIMDISTDWKAKRKIALEVIFECRDENREQIVAALKVKTVLEGQKPVSDVMSIGREKLQNEWKATAYSMTKGNKNQLDVFKEESEGE